MGVKGKTIVLGVTGGIAAYKACIICSQLQQKGARIRVIMTHSATRFVQPLTFQTLSHHHVYTDTFEEHDPSGVAHIDLADEADLFLIAPATANIIGKLANGIADDMLSTTLLATQAPVWMAPAMNGHMYEHPAVQENITKLKVRGVHLIEPGSGLLACGYVGKGRMAEPEEIISAVEQYFETGNPQGEPVGDKAVKHWWQGKRVLVTAGPTQEPLDPVRYLTNHSSGKMGYALTKVLAGMGAEVVLVSGPTALDVPQGVKEYISVVTADEMYQAVLRHYSSVDAVFKAAAVADYHPLNKSEQKIKKDAEEITITFKKNKDILKALGERKKGQILVGFAAETHDLDIYARAKLQNKNLDFIVANNVSKEGAGFGTDTNAVTIYDRWGGKVDVPLLPKEEVAYQIVKVVAERHGLHKE
ncbi:phosphopantothenoylcysteine decarboxylase/phosphopantothenate/cysteine ligase [Caldalkalibacillus thermarum TA2.A1]|uniref:Coenzyme A biosynthesis bifunctional protein CoaBC n=1 Tax=Caldalkalibacillus thermarum (strain TA2.A1) TaxID=986075 RepID=F5L7V0_CALTT|nr:bifunctional phosphopantothenoylcysteine decarboxylase/phosphopantothenate--cysteine ligase CoaBC [Caldalkalibacillus thermarum]EGL82609.1 phosphopantothenoylcysteine decarboxylase/phosphopantothenate/cysteine ligase [Caldalkalibacillus thermarum TA2.A1]QZT32797.1 bifunctional phosphopantothenoylcysteine decarboxylase/phosphopantothenate--cysteine ligase CoaBC [Caldalkalibacillus thermarum TA2.A1]